jgi:putative FmdB family regulatory protein
MILSYQCENCNNVFDILVGVNMEKPKMKCPKCNSKKIIKLISKPSINTGKSGQSGSCSAGSCPTCM